MEKSYSPSEKLRAAILANYEASHDKKETNPHAVANALPMSFSALGEFQSVDPDIKQSGNDRLRMRAEAYGLTFEELCDGLPALRDELKVELTEEDWNIYFEKTL